MILSRSWQRYAAWGVFVLASLAYLGWRAACTITPEARAWSWTFWALEAYAAWCACAFYLLVLERRDPMVRPAARRYSVDVLICTYNEPPDLLRQTIRRALAVRYPHRTWVLDDGRRPGVRALAESLGCGYVTRERNEHYKAGNLNHALGKTDGELVVVLDADHLLRPDFLDRLVGYFDDPAVALVQTPQVFYNLDSFQHHFRPRAGRLWHEGAVFHHAMQPGANRWNAAFFSGSGAVLRRRALQHIGGFATGSVTEDVFTSMRLHAAGWSSVYHDEALGYLLAPDSLQQYLTQRLRWGQGSMQILRIENPLTKPGLTAWQRFAYFTALSSFAQSLVHLAYYLAPALFLLGGPAPLQIGHPAGFGFLLAHIAFDITALHVFLGPLARVRLAECFKFLNVFAYIRSLGGYFRGAGTLAFRVTTKGRDHQVSYNLIAPQLVLLAVNFTALGFGAISLSLPGLSLTDWLGTAMATTFAGYFVLTAGSTIQYARNRLAARGEYTFPDALRTQMTAGGTMLQCTTLRVGAAELYVLCAGSDAPSRGTEAQIELSVEEGQPPLMITGHIKGVEREGEQALVHVGLGTLEGETADRLFDRFVERSIPLMLARVVGNHPSTSSENVPGQAPDCYLEVQARVL